MRPDADGWLRESGAAGRGRDPRPDGYRRVTVCVGICRDVGQISDRSPGGGSAAAKQSTSAADMRRLVHIAGWHHDASRPAIRATTEWTGSDLPNRIIGTNPAPLPDLMATDRPPRYLAAMLAADMVGYSRLLGADEAGTIAGIRKLRNEVLGPAIEEYGGVIVHTAGDGFLIEFSSAVNAVKCALEVQRSLLDANSRVVPDRRLLFRMGIHLGDVVVDGDDIHGNGVNVAARLEALAEPGGILISSSVHENVRNHLSTGFVDIGRRRLKNIDHPVQAYRVLVDPKESRISARRLSTTGRSRRRWIVAAVAAMFLVLGAGGIFWGGTQTKKLDSSQAQDNGPTIPDRPSIAVLAFANLDGDSGRDYFAEGVSEDLITDLSRLPGLFVIARNSSFYYKEKQTTIRQIGRELGIKYILEGSVRRRGDQIRVVARLVDTKTSGQIWTERYDRKLEDVFAIQTEISRKVVATLGQVLLSQTSPIASRGTANVEAYDAYLRGWAQLRLRTPESVRRAVAEFKTAAELDQDYTNVNAALAAAYFVVRRNQWPIALGLPTSFDAMDLALEQIRLAMRRPTPLAFRVRAEMNFSENRFERALNDVDESLARQPNDADTLAMKGEIYIALGRAAEALASLRDAARRDPNQPRHRVLLGVAEFALGRFADSAASLETAYRLNPTDQAGLVHLIAAYGHLGRLRKARERSAELNVLRTSMGSPPFNQFLANKTPQYGNDCDLYRLREGLRLGGVPPGPPPEPPIDGTGCVLAPDK